MNATAFKDKVIEELELLPEETLPDLYRLIHYFRLGLTTASNLEESQATIDQESDYLVDDDFEDGVINAEKAAFIAFHPYLLANYPGEEVAIYQGKIVDHDMDGVALSLRIEQRYPNEFVLISPVTAKPMEEWVVRSPRFEQTVG